ncbi:MAG: CHAT domain-containing protein, partial [Solirubrobacterales bacterium]|nr:CHAT domain-containing protein [Solirubrobacterales bacterium]
MKLFYSNLIEGDPRGEALRQAQLDLAKDPQFSHPANWAAFSLTGAGGPVVNPG